MSLLAAIAAFVLTSPAFSAGGTIPSSYSCDGAGASPPLRWTAPPRGTRSLALSMKDPDAPSGTFVHWTGWNLSPRLRGLAAGQTPARQGRNSLGRRGYTPPCPPTGPAHHYVFRLYALRSKLPLAAGASPAAFDRALRGRVIAVKKLVGRYGRRLNQRPSGVIKYEDSASGSTGTAGAMHIDKSFVIEHLREEGQSEKVQHALDELPEKIDHEKHAQQLEKVGIDPGKLAEKAARRGLASL